MTTTIQAAIAALTRYNHEYNYDGGEMVEDKRGDYFKAEDVLAALQAAQPVQAIDLRAAMMNLPCRPGSSDLLGNSDIETRAYQIGHRDARHAAAELVAVHEHDAQPVQSSITVKEALGQALAELKAMSPDALRTHIDQFKDTQPVQSIDTPEFRELLHTFVREAMPFERIVARITAHIDAHIAERTAIQLQGDDKGGNSDEIKAACYRVDWTSKEPAATLLMAAMKAEIADLRAHIAQRAPVADVCKVNDHAALASTEHAAYRAWAVTENYGDQWPGWQARARLQPAPIADEVAVHSYRRKLADGSYSDWKDCSAEHVAHVQQPEFCDGFQVRTLYTRPPAPNASAPAGELPPLPPATEKTVTGARRWSKSRMQEYARAYVLADRAARAAAAPAEHAQPVACGAHHLTPENIAAVIQDLREIEDGTTERPWEGRDWRAQAGVWHRIMSHLAAPVAAEPAPSMEEINDAFFAWLNKQEEKDGSWELSPREIKRLHTVWMASSEFILSTK